MDSSIINRVLYPPIILLQSTEYTYLTLGSWERGVEKRKEKILSISFFQLISDPSMREVSQYLLPNTNSTYVLVACVCCAERRDMPTLSRMRFSTEHLPFIERYFCARQNSLSVMATGTRIISFLHQFARPVLFCVKVNCPLSRADVLVRTPLHVPAAG